MCTITVRIKTVVMVTKRRNKSHERVNSKVHTASHQTKNIKVIITVRVPLKMTKTSLIINECPLISEPVEEQLRKMSFFLNRINVTLNLRSSTRAYGAFCPSCQTHSDSFLEKLSLNHGERERNATLKWMEWRFCQSYGVYLTAGGA